MTAKTLWQLLAGYSCISPIRYSLKAVIPGCSRYITVVHQMVQEVDGESSVYLISVFNVLALLDKRLKHFKTAEIIDRGLFLHRLLSVIALI